jgi:pimeloyl-ACP methyl ester carboxylesterase
MIRPLFPAPRLAFVGAATRVSGFGNELARRTALVRQPQPAGVRLPRLRLLFGEVGTFVEVRLAARRVRRALRQAAAVAAALPRGRTVMLLPGLGTNPARMAPMRQALEQAGYRVCDWGLGVNLGPTAENFERLCRSIVEVADREGAPLALVGWSLGGLFAREAAKRHPDDVDLVVTLGTPFSGDLHGNRAWRAYQWLAGHAVYDNPVPGDYGAKPPARTVALWSPRDGVVAPRAACGWNGERDEAVALRCTHLGFPRHPQAIAEVLRQLER